MTDLTEQWKKGELPSGWYWVEGCRNKEIYAYTAEYLNHMYRPKNSDRIIEQVPSYDEYLESESHCVVMRELYDIEKEKNAQLKELLKEVKDYLPEFETPMDILAKIDEALR